MVKMGHNRFDQNTLTMFIVALIIIFMAVCLIKVINPAVPDREQILKWMKGIVELNYHNQKITSGWFIRKEGIIVGPHHLIKGWINYTNWFHIIVTDHEKNTYQAKILASACKNKLQA